MSKKARFAQACLTAENTENYRRFAEEDKCSMNKAVNVGLAANAMRRAVKSLQTKAKR